MTTKIYGCSDDLIEFEGDVRGESNFYAGDDDKKAALVVCSDGTVLQVKYGKAGAGIWSIVLANPGALFDRIDACHDEDADPYSDVAHFRDGLKWAYMAREWERVS